MPTPANSAPTTPPPSTSTSNSTSITTITIPVPENPPQPQQPPSETQPEEKPQPHPLFAQYPTKRALVSSIEAGKRAIEALEQQENEIRKELEDKRYEKKVNLKLWEKHRVDTEAATGGADGPKKEW